jgi:O-acetyl-ADP-ribose deacetylase (regulator of RNase III)
MAVEIDIPQGSLLGAPCDAIVNAANSAHPRPAR